MINAEDIKWDDRGLCPCIVQDYDSGRVLTLAYMNRESFEISKERGLTCFFSRSRQELWLKGETSGNYQHIVTMEADCDADAILVRVKKDGPACHTGSNSCFDTKLSMEFMDIYDSEKQKTGVVLDRKSFLQEGQYMLYVLAILENTKGEILITQRALDKKWAAGSWEIPGGGSLAGESSFDAVCREVKEETSLDLHRYFKTAVSPIHSYRNEDLKRGDNYFVDIYHFVFDFQPEEVSIEHRESIDWQCASLQHIGEIHEKDGFLHYQRILDALAAERKA